jgi:hypothetical protein
MLVMLEPAPEAAILGLGELTELRVDSDWIDRGERLRTTILLADGANRQLGLSLPCLLELVEIISGKHGHIDWGDQTSLERFTLSNLQGGDDSDRGPAVRQRIFEDAAGRVVSIRANQANFIRHTLGAFDCMIKESGAVGKRQLRLVLTHAQGSSPAQHDPQQSTVGHDGSVSSTSSTQDRARIIDGNPIVGADRIATCRRSSP